MLTTMSSSGHLVDEGTSSDPAVGLHAVAALRRLVERLENLQVRNARAQDWSWADIASALGVSKQTVHRKHAGRLAPETKGT
jgi:ribosome-binding protein aMBF1 (putative translation factor)